MSTESTSAAHAVRNKAIARRMRAHAVETAPSDPSGARWERKIADELDQGADAYLDPAAHQDEPLASGNGGEVITDPRAVPASKRYLVDTVAQDPDMLSAEASFERVELAENAQALNLAVDAAETIGARNSVEKMLAHQMAAAHKLAMDFISGSRATMEAYAHGGHVHPHCSVEAARMANTAARLMSSYQSAMLALDRIRTGGRQVMTVQHVDVRGGQAVVAGTVNAADREGLAAGPSRRRCSDD